MRANYPSCVPCAACFQVYVHLVDVLIAETAHQRLAWMWPQVVVSVTKLVSGHIGVHTSPPSGVFCDLCPGVPWLPFVLYIAAFERKL